MSVFLLAGLLDGLSWDPVVNATLNVWNPIQCRTTLFWSRFVAAYETGMGRGMGTRYSAP